MNMKQKQSPSHAVHRIDVVHYIVKHWYGISLSALLVLAIVLRFHNYVNRWGLAYDQAHDVAVARYAVESGNIPLVGPFSSGGPFQTGGQWYWIIMTGSLLKFNWILSPWIFMTVLYVLFVFLITIVGSKLIDKRFGLITGLLAAVSTAQITQGTNLTNQSPMALTSLGAIWASALYSSSKKLRYALLAGLFISLGITIHMQGAALVPLVLVMLVLSRTQVLKALGAVIVGGFIPLIPLVLFDLNNDFVNAGGFMQYITQDQYNVSYEVLGRRWLTYLSGFWPSSWGFIIGGYQQVGYAILVLLGAVSLWNLKKHSIPKNILLIGISFILSIIIVRYVRTPLFDSYLVFLHPFVLFLTAWAIYELCKFRKIVGIAVLTVVLSASLYRDIREINAASNTLQYTVKTWTSILDSYYPDTQFWIYDHKMKTKDRSVSLSVFLDVENKIDPSGAKVGVLFATSSAQLTSLPVIYGTLHETQLVDLSASSSAELDEYGWYPVNPKDIYLSTEEWYSQGREN
jgi:hypothetical protein